MTSDEARERLQEWRAEREQTEREGQALMSELATLVLQAKDAGMTITAIAKESGISRSTIYTCIKGQT